MGINKIKEVSLTELKKQRDELASVVAKLDDAIRILEGSQEKPVDWKNNTLQCLKTQDRFLSTNDILEYIFRDEAGKLEDERKRRNYISALSLAINNLCRDYVVGRVGVRGHKGFYYGLRPWFDPANGGVLPPYNQKLEDDLWMGVR